MQHSRRNSALPTRESPDFTTRVFLDFGKAYLDYRTGPSWKSVCREARTDRRLARVSRSLLLSLIPHVGGGWDDGCFDVDGLHRSTSSPTLPITGQRRLIRHCRLVWLHRPCVSDCSLLYLGNGMAARFQSLEFAVQVCGEAIAVFRLDLRPNSVQFFEDRVFRHRRPLREIPSVCKREAPKARDHPAAGRLPAPRLHSRCVDSSASGDIVPPPAPQWPDAGHPLVLLRESASGQSIHPAATKRSRSCAADRRERTKHGGKGGSGGSAAGGIEISTFLAPGYTWASTSIALWPLKAPGRAGNLGTPWTATTSGCGRLFPW